jgi:uncharacterized protein
MAQRIVAFSITLLIAAASALAAEPPSREEALARELLEAAGGQQMGAQVIRQMVESLAATQPQARPELWDELLAEVDPAELVELVVPVYVKHLTAEEMEAAIAFYRSPMGQSMLSKMPLVMEESMRLGQEWGTDVMQRVLEKLEERSAAPADPSDPPASG